MTTAALSYYRREKTPSLVPEKSLFPGLHVVGGTSKTARELSTRLWEMSLSSGAPSRIQPRPAADRKGRTETTHEQLFDALAAAKLMTSRVAMHLKDTWRRDLFQRLDSLLDAEEWHSDDPALSAASFETYLRFVLFIRPSIPPSLGISDHGNLLAGWIDGRNRLSMEFLPLDLVRWVLVRYMGDERETAAAQVSVARLMEVLAPFEPDRWLRHGTNTDR